MSAQPTITAPPVAEATDPVPPTTPEPAATPVSAEPAVVAEPADDLDGLSLGELRRLAMAKGWSTATRANKARLKEILREHPDGPPAVVAAASRQDGQYTPPVINEPQPDQPTPAWQPDGDDLTEEETADESEDGDESSLSPLAAACAAGTVALYRLRGTGTTRRLPWLTGGALETAEWYRLRVDQGATVRQVAEECLTSKPTVRRALNALALMEEITDGLHDDAYTEGVTEILFTAEAGDDETADEA